MSDTSTPTPARQSNEDRKRDALAKRIQRAHDWRVQVWAQSELRIQGFQAEIEVLGGDRIELFDPQFDDADMLRHYAEMPLNK